MKSLKTKLPAHECFITCRVLILTLGVFLLNTTSRAASPQFRSVWYHRLQGSFWAQLADDSGPSPTPRELAIVSIQNNFIEIRALGFNTVTIGLPDEGGWVSQHGGGFSYDPKNAADAKPQFAVAQEIVLRIAEASHLKVIFAIGLAEYRRSTDGRAAWAGLADQYNSTATPKGAYDFIHALIDPRNFYGTQLTTTKLSAAGLADGPVMSHIGDPRIAGWILSGEWNVNVVNASSKKHPHEVIFKKYWNFFYNLVHFHDASTAFAATYLIGQPSGGDAQVNNIKAFKQWFAPGSGIRAPDLIGIECYGNAGYNLASVYNGLNKMVDAMSAADKNKYPHDFEIPAQKIFIGEANTNQTTSPAINEYFEDVFQVIADRSLAGIQLWVSDTLGDGKDADGKLTLSVTTPAYDLFTTTFAVTSTRKYAGLPGGVSWFGPPAPHTSYADPANYVSSTGLRASAYGKWGYTGLTAKGNWVQQAMANHEGMLNLSFFANPNPINAATSSTTLYWDVSRMPEVKKVEIHSGSASGPVVAKGKNKGNANVAITSQDKLTFFLVAAGNDKALGIVTLQSQ